MEGVGTCTERAKKMAMEIRNNTDIVTGMDNTDATLLVRIYEISVTARLCDSLDKANNIGERLLKRLENKSLFQTGTEGDGI